MAHPFYVLIDYFNNANVDCFTTDPADGGGLSRDRFSFNFYPEQGFDTSVIVVESSGDWDLCLRPDGFIFRNH